MYVYIEAQVYLKERECEDIRFEHTFERHNRVQLFYPMHTRELMHILGEHEQRTDANDSQLILFI